MSFKICGILENLANFVRYAWGSCWFDIDISIYTHQIFINLLSVQRGGIHLFGDVKKRKNSEFQYEYFTVKICGILENLVNCVRYAWGCCWFDMNISIHTHQIFINLVSV